jgi:uncharacterized protein (DUF58 family)
MTTAPAARTFPLVPRRRFLGVQLGETRSRRRGPGDETAGSRPYRPGDRPEWIDWAASARLSAARGTDEFVVREYFAEEAPRVAVVRDRRPAMRLYPPPLPWLDKDAAADAAVRLIAASALAARGELGLVDHAIGRPLWPGPGELGHAGARTGEEREDGLRRSLELLVRFRGDFPVGSFAFVVSDFLAPVPGKVWAWLRSLRWDVTPVIVQDPLWEQSFPRVGGVALPLADPVTGEEADVWVSRRAARRHAEENEVRLERLLAGFRRLGFDPVLLGDADEDAILARFSEWAARRARLAKRSH